MEFRRKYYIIMARKSTSKKTLNLETAKVADAELKPIRSVYELVGIKNVSYYEKTYPDYQKSLAKMSLLEMHDHAFSIGVPCAASKEIMVDRLERKYLQENPQQREAWKQARDAGKDGEKELSVQEQAKLILSRGR